MKKSTSDFKRRASLATQKMFLLQNKMLTSLLRSSRQLTSRSSRVSLISNRFYQQLVIARAKQTTLNFSRIKTYCLITDHSRGVYSKHFGVSRMVLKRLVVEKRLLGVKYLSW